MAYQVGSACYPTSVAAAQVSASSQIGSVVAHGTTSYVINATAADATSITYVLSPVGGGASITVVAPYDAQPCSLMDYQDALSMAWLVVGAWAAAYALLFITRAFRGETGSDYGNA